MSGDGNGNDTSAAARLANSIALSIAEGVAESVGGEPAGAMVREGAERVIPPGFDGQDLDAAAAIGALAGLDISQEGRLLDPPRGQGQGRGQERGQSDDTAQRDAQGRQERRERRETPPVTAREIRHPDGTTVAVRAYAATADASIEETGVGNVVVTAEGVDHPIPIPFTINEIEDKGGRDFSEWEIKAASMIEPPSDEDESANDQ